MQAENIPNAVALRGRPPKAGLEDRILDASIKLYAERGWNGFTFAAVSRLSGAGKSALYRRWSSRGELLRHTLEARWANPAGHDTGSIEGDLMALAGGLFDLLAGPFGAVLLHMRTDAARSEDVSSAIRSYTGQLADQALAIVRRAVNRQELPPSTSRALIVDLVVGGLLNRFSAVSPERKKQMVSGRDDFIRELVGIVVRGAQCGR